ncbi:MAG: hypothetical protein QM817_22550 [Archangium sp.]
MAMVLVAVPLEFELVGSAAAEVRDRAGRTVWKCSASDETVAPDACVDGGELRLTVRDSGKTVTLRQRIDAPPSSIRCLARFHEGSTGLEVTVFARVPDDLEVTVGETDDATGLGVFTIQNPLRRKL